MRDGEIPCTAASSGILVGSGWRPAGVIFRTFRRLRGIGSERLETQPKPETATLWPPVLEGLDDLKIAIAERSVPQVLNLKRYTGKREKPPGDLRPGPG